MLGNVYKSWLEGEKISVLNCILNVSEYDQMKNYFNSRIILNSHDFNQVI